MRDKKIPAGNTQELVEFIDAGNERTLGNMKDAEDRLSSRMENPAVKCEISDPLLDVFRAQRDSSAQIMDNQVLTFQHIVKRLDSFSGNGNSNGNSMSVSGNSTPASNGDKEMKAGKWFSLKNYRIQDVISLIVIMALVIICLSREYMNYLRVKQTGKDHQEKTEMIVGSTRGDNK